VLSARERAGGAPLEGTPVEIDDGVVEVDLTDEAPQDLVREEFRAGRLIDEKAVSRFCGLFTWPGGTHRNG